MSTLYIRLAPKALTDDTSGWLALPSSFAFVSNGNTIEHQGIDSLSNLSEIIKKAQRVVLILAASDVTILRLQAPPMSPSKLKAALPNLVEEQILTDPTDCWVVAGNASDGLRTIAVVQRTFINNLYRTLLSWGARRISAFPAQMCLPNMPEKPGSAIAAISIHNTSGQDTCVELTVHTPQNDYLGLVIMPDKAGSVAHSVIQTLISLFPELPISLYVPVPLLPEYQEKMNEPDNLSNHISVIADDWSRWVASATELTLDLIPGLGSGAGTNFDWRPWRWTMAIITAVLVVNVIALNIDWWNLRNEAKSLRASMIQIYKSNYPKESVILDPIAQMQQKIALARHGLGLPASDDFTLITSAFSEALSNIDPTVGKSNQISTIDYHDHSLYVQLKPGSQIQTKKLGEALAKYHLHLETSAEQSDGIVLKIGSAK